MSVQTDTYSPPVLWSMTSRLAAMLGQERVTCERMLSATEGKLDFAAIRLAAEQESLFRDQALRTTILLTPPKSVSDVALSLSVASELVDGLLDCVQDGEGKAEIGAVVTAINNAVGALGALLMPDTLTFVGNISDDIDLTVQKTVVDYNARIDTFREAVVALEESETYAEESQSEGVPTQEMAEWTRDAAMHTLIATAPPTFPLLTEKLRILSQALGFSAAWIVRDIEQLAGSN